MEALSLHENLESKSPKILGLQIANPQMPHLRKVRKFNKFCKPANLRICETVPYNISAHIEMHWYHFTKLYKTIKNTLSLIETIPLKSKQSGWIFEKKERIYTRIYFSNRVFIKSIITHPFPKHFNSNNSIYKILTTPSYGLKEP